MILFYLLTFIAIGQTEMIFLQSLPANPMLLDQTEFRLNRLLRYLRKNGPINKYELYERTKLCQIYLSEMEKQTSLDYDNLIEGSCNRVHGLRNIILGSKNSLSGCNNWVFTANYTAKASHTLVLDHWRINLDEIENIKTNPSRAIEVW